MRTRPSFSWSFLSSFVGSFVPPCVAACVLGSLVQCGGRVDEPPAAEDVDAAPEGGRTPPVPEGGLPYVDPTCPDAAPPPIDNRCDVLRPTETCPQGRACAPITFPPDGPCGVERYGSACIVPGTGVQGDSCAQDTMGCAAGFVCVITGGNTQCAKACELGRKAACESGFVCEPIDVPGYAVCL